MNRTASRKRRRFLCACVLPKRSARVAGDIMTDRWWQRPLVKPQALRPGDRVAIVSTSWGGPAVFPHRYEAGKRYLTDAFGLVPIEMPHALREADWLDRNPQAPAEDIHTAFSDPSIRGVIASIGGDDA